MRRGKRQQAGEACGGGCLSDHCRHRANSLSSGLVRRTVDRSAFRCCGMLDDGCVALRALRVRSYVEGESRAESEKLARRSAPAGLDILSVAPQAFGPATSPFGFRSGPVTYATIFRYGHIARFSCRESTDREFGINSGME